MILHGDCLEILPTLEANSIQCVVTSPPYYGLRDYGVEGQIGLEDTPEAYVEKLVAVFGEVKRVLRDDGTVWLNLGDSYASNQSNNGGYSDKSTLVGFSRPDTKGRLSNENYIPHKINHGLKPKDLIGIPWRVAFALQADGWWLRQDIIWCLSGGTWLYARTQKGDMPMMVRDMARLDPSTVKLWNGEKWTQVLGWSKSQRQGDEIEFVLRSGERISCTPTHKFPTSRGLLEAKDIIVGDCFETTTIPEPDSPKDTQFINQDIAWFIGLYIAEGSRHEGKIVISGHTKESERWLKVKSFADKYGGTATLHNYGNKQAIRVNGKIINAILSEYVSGRTAKDKCLSVSCWKHSNKFLRAVLDGYLSGDGAWDSDNKRWRIGFTRNYNLERDLRVLSARLGFNLTLNLSNSFIDGKKYPSFRGEIKFEATFEGHWNRKNKAEIVAVKKSRCREVYDIGVADEPHLFSLASGILTHNSKPNPMPESVTDRCTKSHEYIFLLTKSARYFYDAEAVKEPQQQCTTERYRYGWNGVDDDGSNGARTGSAYKKMKAGMNMGDAMGGNGMRNKRSVWTISTKPYRAAHFATFPQEIPEICIKAGSRVGDTILDPFSGAGTTGLVADKLGRKYIGIELNPTYAAMGEDRIFNDCPLFAEASC